MAKPSANSAAPPKLKPTPTPASEATITDELREAQKAYLLLQLLNAENQTLTKGDANKFTELRDAGKVALGFTKTAVPNLRRERLAELGYLKITPGRSAQYSLLPDGLEYLAACTRHLGHLEIKALKGRTINALIAAAREPAFQQSPPTVQPAVEPGLPTPTQLADAILAEFEELRREHHSRSGLVPIHQVRQRIAERFGPEAARHDVLDEAILSLWREKLISLEGISDLGSATEQQLNDSIQGVGNTLFYLEVPRDQPVIA